MVLPVREHGPTEGCLVARHGVLRTEEIFARRTDLTDINPTTSLLGLRFAQTCRVGKTGYWQTTATNHPTDEPPRAARGDCGFRVHQDTVFPGFWQERMMAGPFTPTMDHGRQSRFGDGLRRRDPAISSRSFGCAHGIRTRCKFDPNKNNYLQVETVEFQTLSLRHSFLNWSCHPIGCVGWRREHVPWASLARQPSQKSTETSVSCGLRAIILGILRWGAARGSRHSRRRQWRWTGSD